MKNTFVYTFNNFNKKIEKIINEAIKIIKKNNNYELVILCNTNNNELNEFIDIELKTGTELKYYRPKVSNVGVAELKNYFLNLADNSYISFLSETAILNTFFLMNLPLLKNNNILFSDDSRHGLFLTAHRDTFLKVNGFDNNLFSSSVIIEDEDIKNRIVFSRIAKPVLLFYKHLAASCNIILDCDIINAENYDNFTPFKNISEKKYILPELRKCENIVFNNSVELN